jgi:hypothetical protein
MRRNGSRSCVAPAVALAAAALLAASCTQPPGGGGGTTTTTTGPTSTTTQPGGGGTPKYQSSDQWATWQDGGYTLYNNIWGSGAGSQTLWANSYRNWGVRANHPNTGGVKSYPNASRPINKRLSAIRSLSSRFAVQVPSAGAYTSAYDVWADGHNYEIMIWVNKYGPVGPIGGQEATATVGGHTWAVHRGSNGANAVFSFVRQGNTNSGSIDAKAIFEWIKARGWFGTTSTDVTISDFQFGYEITSASGGLDFTTNDYEVTST